MFRVSFDAAGFHVVAGEVGCSRLEYRVYLVATGQLCTFVVREDEMQTIRMMTSGDACVVEVDLPTGRLTVDANVKPLAEYLTLAFAVGVLLVTMRKPSYLLVMATAHIALFLNTYTFNQKLGKTKHTVSHWRRQLWGTGARAPPRLPASFLSSREF